MFGVKGIPNTPPFIVLFLRTRRLEPLRYRDRRVAFRFRDLRVILFAIFVSKRVILYAHIIIHQIINDTTGQQLFLPPPHLYDHPTPTHPLLDTTGRHPSSLIRPSNAHPPSSLIRPAVRPGAGRRANAPPKNPHSASELSHPH